MRSTIKLIIASPTLLSILCLSCAKGPSPGSTSFWSLTAGLHYLAFAILMLTKLSHFTGQS